MTVSRETLYAEVFAEPMTVVATRYHVSANTDTLAMNSATSFMRQSANRRVMPWAPAASLASSRQSESASAQCSRGHYS